MGKLYVSSHLRDMNRHIVYQTIAQQGVTSKAEISNLTGISPPTTIKIVNYLLDNGMVVELGEGESRIGRKPQLLALNKSLFYVAVFFYEGEFLTQGIVDSTGALVYKKSLRCAAGLESIMQQIGGGLADTMFHDANIPLTKMAGIGIALPAIYNPINRTITAPLIGAHQPASVHHHICTMEERYGVPVLVENDTNAQSVGEFRASGLSDEQDMIFLSAGTGIGAGIILHGELRRGPHNMCGEIGYFAFTSNHSPQALGSPGWLESRVSFRRIEEKFGIASAADIAALPAKITQIILEEVAQPLALTVNQMVMLLDCRNIRLGGIVVNLLGDALIDELNRQLAALCICPVQVQKQCSEDTGLIGLADPLLRQKIHALLTQEDTPGKTLHTKEIL